METLSSNILVLSKKGKVLGVSICPGVDEITELIDDKIGGHIDPLLNERFLGVSFHKGECQSPDTWFRACTRKLSGNRIR